jgi:hypothetical protein
VIFWLGVGVGSLLEIGGFAAVIIAEPTGWKIVGALAIVAGLIVFGIGRAVRYVVAAR